MTRTKRTLKTASMPAGIASGILFALIMTLSSAAITAKMIQLQWMDQEKIGYAVMVILFISAFLGAIISCAKIKENKPIACVIFGLIFFSLLLGTKMLFFEGKLSGVGETMLLILGGSILSVFLKTERKKRKNPRIRKYHNR